MNTHELPGVTLRDLEALQDVERHGAKNLAAMDAGIHRRMSVQRLLRQRWSPKSGWLVQLTGKGVSLLREFDR